MDLSVGLSYIVDKLTKVFLSPGSMFSLTSLACATCVAVLYFVVQRRRKDRRVRIRTLVRALFPKRITTSASLSTDIGYFFLNTLVFGLIFGWAILSYQVLSNGIVAQLVATFGAVGPTTLPAIVTSAAMTLALFLAYELAYWIDHYLSHRVPILWEFHKVHHEATVLTPLTVFRIHPIDGLVHANITAVVMAVTNGGMSYLFGKTAFQYVIADSNLIFVLFVHAYVHLQHSHMWISFRGVLGHILLSPAHHQIHHSTDPAHFNKNLGSCLAIWDWLFGTLYVPAKESEKVRFGLDEAPDAARSRRNVHSIPHSFAEPFVRVAGHLARLFPEAQPQAGRGADAGVDAAPARHEARERATTL